MVRLGTEYVLIAAGAAGVVLMLVGSRFASPALTPLLILSALLVCGFVLLAYWFGVVKLLLKAARCVIGSGAWLDLLPERRLARLLFAHAVAAVVFYPLCLIILPRTHPGGMVLEGVNLTNAVIAAPIATPVLLVDRTLSDLTSPYRNYPSSAWFWACYLLPWAPVYLLLWRASRKSWRMKHSLCLKCGYDLRCSEQRCPECGTAMVVPSQAIEPE